MHARFSLEITILNVRILGVNVNRQRVSHAHQEIDACE